MKDQRGTEAFAARLCHEPPAVGFHELARNRQAQAGAVLFASEERREDRLVIGRASPGTLIGHR
jgi:hypothetical protein